LLKTAFGLQQTIVYLLSPGMYLQSGGRKLKFLSFCGHFRFYLLAGFSKTALSFLKVHNGFI
jgi:hypothetical protein